MSLIEWWKKKTGGSGAPWGFARFMLDAITTAYSKEKPNVNKLFTLLGDALEEGRKPIEQVRELRDMDNATGANLDLYGRNWGVRRDGLPDELYRLVIFTKVISLISGGDVNTVINAAAVIFQIDPSDVRIHEVFPAKVRIEVPTDILERVGDEGRLEIVLKYIKRVLAAAIWMDFILYESMEMEGEVYVASFLLENSSYTFPAYIPEKDVDPEMYALVGAALGEQATYNISAE